MPEVITIQDLEKASRNLERMSRFIGERREWLLGAGGEAAAKSAREAAISLAETIADLADTPVDAAASVDQPPKIEPAAKVSANRLLKFADFMEQLRRWFVEHDDAGLPADCDGEVKSMLSSLAVTGEALLMLFGSAAVEKSPQEEPPGEDEPGPESSSPDAVGSLTGNDLGPVAEVDPSARLVLEDTDACPLLQEFKGVVELTVEAKKMLDDFLAEQGVELGKYERRRLHDKVLRWIEGTPPGRVLVIKISGLYGKPEAYSSYQPKENAMPDSPAGV